MVEKRAPKRAPKKPESGASKQNVYVISPEAMQKTVELLGSVPLAYPASIPRDQLIAYYSQLNAVEVENNDGNKTS